jgi:hypothetical protein
MKRFLPILGLIMLSMSSSLPAQSMENGYYLPDHSCFDWKGPNGQTYSVQWVGRTKFQDCGDNISFEIFTDIFHVNSVNLAATGDWTGFMFGMHF